MFTIKRGTHTSRGDNPPIFLTKLCPFFDLEFSKCSYSRALAPACGALGLSYNEITFFLFFYFLNQEKDLFHVTLRVSSLYILKTLILKLFFIIENTFFYRSFSIFDLK